jgi:signal transduction histidine kinase
VNTLFARLGLALLAVVALIGAGFYTLEYYSSRVYYEELTQRLNGDIAMYVTGERQLMAGGRVDEDALQALSEQAMVINPTVEVYLLDPQGRILSHGMPGGTVQARQVDMTPVRAYIAGDAVLPVRSTDPRAPGQTKIFSAHPVMDGDTLQGYLYAVLGGRYHDQLASRLRESYVQRVSMGAMLAIAAGGLLVGLLVFGLMTRRLSRLTRDVRRFTESGFDPELLPPLPSTSQGSDDEIGQLRGAFARMASTIREQVERLEENDRLRRELISNVSHDLRTPLASMHGYVETLLLKNDSLDAEERRGYLETARKHTGHLARLIGDLFELSKLDAATIQPRWEPFSLAELLQDVTREFDLEAEQRGITLLFDTPRQPFTVYADIGLVQRVLENLLRNALKFTPRGGTVSLRLDNRDDAVAVAVEDTGCGIPEEDLEFIFDRFYRAENGRGRREDSSGLGLAIVQRILDLHGRSISVESRAGKGTRFEFDLPVPAAA